MIFSYEFLIVWYQIKNTNTSMNTNTNTNTSITWRAVGKKTSSYVPPPARLQTFLLNVPEIIFMWVIYFRFLSYLLDLGPNIFAFVWFICWIICLKDLWLIFSECSRNYLFLSSLFICFQFFKIISSITNMIWSTRPVTHHNHPHYNQCHKFYQKHHQQDICFCS